MKKNGRKVLSNDYGLNENNFSFENSIHFKSEGSELSKSSRSSHSLMPIKINSNSNNEEAFVMSKYTHKNSSSISSKKSVDLKNVENNQYFNDLNIEKNSISIALDKKNIGILNRLKTKKYNKSTTFNLEKVESQIDEKNSEIDLEIDQNKSFHLERKKKRYKTTIDQERANKKKHSVLSFDILVLGKTIYNSLKEIENIKNEETKILKRQTSTCKYIRKRMSNFKEKNEINKAIFANKNKLHHYTKLVTKCIYKLPLLKNLFPSHESILRSIKRLIQIIKPISFGENEIVQSYNEIKDNVYVLLEGSVKIIKPVLIEEKMTKKQYLNYLLHLKAISANNLYFDVIGKNQMIYRLYEKEFDKIVYDELGDNYLQHISKVNSNTLGKENQDINLLNKRISVNKISVAQGIYKDNDKNINTINSDNENNDTMILNKNLNRGSFKRRENVFFNIKETNEKESSQKIEDDNDEDNRLNEKLFNNKLLNKFYDINKNEYCVSTKQYLKIMNNGITNSDDYYEYIKNNDIEEEDNSIKKEKRVSIAMTNLSENMKKRVSFIVNIESNKKGSFFNNSNLKTISSSLKKQKSKLLESIERSEGLKLANTFINIKIDSISHKNSKTKDKEIIVSNDINSNIKLFSENSKISEKSSEEEESNCINIINLFRSSILNVNKPIKKENASSDFFKKLSTSKINLVNVIRNKVKKKLESESNLKAQALKILYSFYNSTGMFDGQSFLFRIYKFEIVDEKLNSAILDENTTSGINDSTIITSSNSKFFVFKANDYNLQMESIYDIIFKEKLSVIFESSIFSRINKIDGTKNIYNKINVIKLSKGNIYPNIVNIEPSLNNIGNLLIVKSGKVNVYINCSHFDLKMMYNSIAQKEFMKELEYYEEAGVVTENFLNKKIKICIKKLHPNEVILFDERNYLYVKYHFNKHRITHNNFKLLNAEIDKHYIDDLNVYYKKRFFTKEQCLNYIKENELDYYVSFLDKPIYDNLLSDDAKQDVKIDTKQILIKTISNHILWNILISYALKLKKIKPFLIHSKIEYECDSSSCELYTINISNLSTLIINSYQRYIFMDNISKFVRNQRIFFLMKLKYLFSLLKEVFINNKNDKIKNKFNLDETNIQNTLLNLRLEENDLEGGTKNIADTLRLKTNFLNNKKEISKSSIVFCKTKNTVILNSIMSGDMYGLDDDEYFKDGYNRKDIQNLKSKKDLNYNEVNALLVNNKMEQESLKINKFRSNIVNLKYSLQSDTFKDRLVKNTSFQKCNKEYQNKYKSFSNTKEKLLNEMDTKINNMGKMEIQYKLDRLKEMNLIKKKKIGIFDIVGINDPIKEVEYEVTKLLEELDIKKITISSDTRIKESIKLDDGIESLNKLISTERNKKSSKKMITNNIENVKNENKKKEQNINQETSENFKSTKNLIPKNKIKNSTLNLKNVLIEKISKNKTSKNITSNIKSHSNITINGIIDKRKNVSSIKLNEISKKDVLNTINNISNEKKELEDDDIVIKKNENIKLKKSTNMINLNLYKTANIEEPLNEKISKLAEINRKNYHLFFNNDINNSLNKKNKFKNVFKNMVFSAKPISCNYFNEGEIPKLDILQLEIASNKRTYEENVKEAGNKAAKIFYNMNANSPKKKPHFKEEESKSYSVNKSISNQNVDVLTNNSKKMSFELIDEDMVKDCISVGKKKGKKVIFDKNSINKRFSNIFSINNTLSDTLANQIEIYGGNIDELKKRINENEKDQLNENQNEAIKIRNSILDLRKSIFKKDI